MTRILEFTEEDARLMDEGAVLEGGGDVERLAAARAKIAEAAAAIKRGGLVAFPTETVYGLGADAFDAEAVKRVYAVKGRPGDNPMIVHVARAGDVCLLTDGLTPMAVRLIDAFWPGPLTLVLSKREGVPSEVTGGLATVAVRMPDDPLALALIRAAGTPVAAPSANLSGKPSPTKASHVIKDLDGLADVIMCGRDCRVGIESTVLDLSEGNPVILRPGVVGAADVEAVIGKEVAHDPSLLAARLGSGGGAVDGAAGAAPKSPGMKYRHYAPQAEMLVLEGDRERVRRETERLTALNEGLGRKVGAIFFEERAFVEAAHDLFARLREMDEAGVDLIIAGALSDGDSLGFAVMNRMLKAAGYNVARV
ncbi:MAG: threonylcarbamoyl-AMP synthase [Clostridiales Family XIII bacterium]|jgi:L-threonylcarbamoyladenylate synthase|nr:threonylcarbamoyl-AMP synthase [Clostridiales Family XIII bacterium]